MNKGLKIGLILFGILVLIGIGASVIFGSDMSGAFAFHPWALVVFGIIVVAFIILVLVLNANKDNR